MLLLKKEPEQGIKAFTEDLKLLEKCGEKDSAGMNIKIMTSRNFGIETSFLQFLAFERFYHGGVQNIPVLPEVEFCIFCPILLNVLQVYF